MLMDPQDTVLVVVDVQEKLVPVIADHPLVTWNIRRLVDAAQILGVQILATEQYPQGLGPTIGPLGSLLPPRFEKVTFSCLGCRPFLDALESLSVSKALVAGLEAHVCVLQTAYDLAAAGYAVYIAADAVGSRRLEERDIALRRLDSSGATITSTEAAIMEWCATADTPHFNRISRLVREPRPGVAGH